MKTLALIIVVTCASAGSAFAQTSTPDQGTAGAARVTGVIQLESGKDLRTGAVTLTRTDGSAAAIGPALAARMYPDGAFFFVNVEPGRYMLRASAQPFDDKRSMYGTQDVNVDTTGAAAASLTSLRIILRQTTPPAPPPPQPDSSTGSFSTLGVPPMPQGATATRPPQ